MAEKTHFDLSKKRYETEGINTRLNILYRFLIWQLIDELGENMDLDYLQVFELKSKELVDEKGKVIYEMTLTHSQEIPEYSNSYIFRVEEPVNEKIYVIDDGDYATMLFAHEY